MEDKYKERLKKYKRLEGEFWSIKYPSMSREEKVSYWSSSLNRQMRWNVESGLSEYAVFSNNDYQCWKEKDPQFHFLIHDIVSRLNCDREKVCKLLGIKPR